MASLSYYLPVIIIAVVVVVVIVFGIHFIREYLRIRKDGSTCIYCKGEAAKASSRVYLFLLPQYHNIYEYPALIVHTL